MTDNKRNAADLKLLGGRLCLDFINTLDWRGAEVPLEFLNTYRDLVIWSRHVGICTPGEARQLSKLAKSSESQAQKIRNQAIKLRETMYRIFSAIGQNNNPTEKDLAEFSRHLAESMKSSQIVKTEAGFAWNTAGNKTRLEWILDPIIRSAADLLVSDEIKHVKACADPACGWLFLDVSRNKKRRWCDMQICGNRAKASRFYKKKQGRI